MGTRQGWSAAALYALLFAIGCGRDIPPRGPGLGEGTTGVSARSGAGGSGSGGSSSTSNPSKRPDAGTRASTSEDDAGMRDPDRDDDAGSPKGLAADRARSGHWVGSTSQAGRTIEFDLSDEGMTELRLVWFLFGCGDGDNKTLFSPAIPLGDEFSTAFTLAATTRLTVSGTFDGDDRVSGALTFESMPATGQFGCIGATATWNATREAP